MPRSIISRMWKHWRTARWRKRRFFFLGSSVTKGACSLDVSMADYIAQLDQCEVVKEAVGGTTLSTAKDNSYVERLNNLKTNQEFDLVVCQHFHKRRVPENEIRRNMRFKKYR